MPLVAAVPLIASLGAGALGASATVAGVVGAGAGLAADAIVANNSGNKAQSYLQPNTINTTNLEDTALQIGQQNAAASRALQNEYTPWVTSGQQQTNQGYQTLLGNQTQALAPATNYLNSNLTAPLNSSLINQASNVASGQLSLGGQLDQGTMNAVTRQGLATAGQATPGGLGQGASVTARDLGLTSQQLLNQRLQNASGIGNQQLSASQASANAILGRISALSGLTQQPIQNYGQAAGMYNSIQSPTAGLSPGSVANLAVGNQNSLNQYQTSMANILGQQAQNQSSLGALASMIPLGGVGQNALKSLFGPGTSSTVGSAGAGNLANLFPSMPNTFASTIGSGAGDALSNGVISDIGGFW